MEVATSTEGNTTIQLAGESFKQAQVRFQSGPRRTIADVESALRYESRTSYLGAYGIKVNIPIPGFSFPSFVSPFDVMDARLSGTQTVFDFSSIPRFEAPALALVLAGPRAEQIEA